jgi:hypothetical protein
LPSPTEVYWHLIYTDQKWICNLKGYIYMKEVCWSFLYSICLNIHSVDRWIMYTSTYSLSIYCNTYVLIWDEYTLGTSSF